MTNAEKDEASIDIKGTIQSIRRGPRATWISIKANTSPHVALVDVTYFGNLPNREKGDRVHIVGRVGSEKSGQKQIGKNGREYDKWVPFLVAEKVELLGEGQPRLPGTGTRLAANDNNGDDDIPF